MANVHFFTGENGFALRQEKRRWMEEFAQRHGPENLVAVDGEALSLRQLLDEVGTAPFIAAKRLIVVSGVPKMTREEVDALLVAIHPDCVVLFCDPRPDKRLQGVKALLQTAAVKEFTPLAGKSLRTWLQDEARGAGAEMDGPAAEALLEMVGPDQDMLAQEVRKLALHAQSGAISREAVDLLAVPSAEREIWTLTSLLSRGDRAGALRYSRALLRGGEDAFSLWNVLLWYVRSFAAVAIAASDGHRNPAKAAAAAGVPFPTARTVFALAQSADLRAVRSLVDWAVRADRELKSGGYRATGEAPQELVALIDELILRASGLTEWAPLRSA